MRYINDDRSLPADTILGTEKLKKPRENNAQILQTNSSSLPKHFSSFQMFNVQALSSIDVGEELLLKYGSK